jgi:hypothetical protein
MHKPQCKKFQKKKSDIDSAIARYNEISQLIDPSTAKCSKADCANVEEAAGTFLFCGKCKQLKYCSKVCQLDDWKTHKKICKKQDFSASIPVTKMFFKLVSILYGDEHISKFLQYMPISTARLLPRMMNDFRLYQRKCISMIFDVVKIIFYDCEENALPIVDIDAERTDADIEEELSSCCKINFGQFSDDDTTIDKIKVGPFNDRTVLIPIQSLDIIDTFNHRIVPVFDPILLAINQSINGILNFNEYIKLVLWSLERSSNIYYRLYRLHPDRDVWAPLQHGYVKMKVKMKVKK